MNRTIKPISVILAVSITLTFASMITTHASTLPTTRIILQSYDTYPPTVYCDIYTHYQARITNNVTTYRILTVDNPICYAPIDTPINIAPQP